MSTSPDQPKPGLDTLALHGGQNVDPATKARAVPIYQTTSYVFDDTGHAARLFALEEFGNIYTRIMNPTTDVLEQRITALEGGVGGLARRERPGGDRVLGPQHRARRRPHRELRVRSTAERTTRSSTRCRNTASRRRSSNRPTSRPGKRPSSRTRKRSSPKRSATRKSTCSTSRRVSDAAHAAGVPLIVDNTLPTPILLRPIEYGADVIVHSATKFIGGHGTSIGGLIVDAGKFNWDNGKFPELIEPDPSYHGAQYVKSFGPLAYILKMRVQLLRDIGAALSPFNAFLLLQGMETLGLRMERHCSNAQAVAEFLEKDKKVTSVRYPGLREDPTYDKARKYLPNGPARS